METITSLRKQLAAKNKEIDEIQQSPRFAPEVIKARKDYENALEKARIAMREKLNKAFAEEKVIEEQIKNLEQEKDSKIPEEVTDFLHKLCQGVNWGDKGWNVKWVSPKKRFVILTNPGHTYWAAIGTYNYSPSKHYLFNLKQSNNIGLSLRDSCVIKTVEGRLSATTIKEWKEYALKEE
jgi:hypothetical protein